MSAIRVTPEELMELANRVVRKSEELADLLNILDHKIDTVDAAWDGLSQNAFYNKYAEMRPKLQAFPQIVNAIGARAQGAAKGFDDIDTGLVSMFNG